MKINLTPNEYYYVLFLAQLQLIEKEKEQGSLTELSQKLYNAFESELDRLHPNRKCMIVNK